MDYRRKCELEEWERETGRTLPRMPAEIMRLEDQGYIVDLLTGDYYADPDAPRSVRVAQATLAGMDSLPALCAEAGQEVQG